MEPSSSEPFVIEPVGDIDASNATREIHEPAVAAIEDGYRHVVFDFTGVRFIDSTTMSALLEVRQLMADNGGRLRLANVPPPIQRFLRIAGVVELFEEGAGS